MLPDTDLNKVKNRAKALLYLDLRTIENGMFVQHPYFTSTFCAVKENGKNLMLDLNKEDDLKKARYTIESEIAAAEEYSRFLMLIRSPYLPVFFSLTNQYLSIKDFSEFLASLWTRVEFPNEDPNVSVKEFIALFRKADRSFLMKECEQQLWKTLPERITVYRGINSKGKVKGLSWTLSEDKARWFADRWNGKGIVYKATINKTDSFAYFGTRGEDEIVLDCNKLHDICKV